MRRLSPLRSTLFFAVILVLFSLFYSGAAGHIPIFLPPSKPAVPVVGGPAPGLPVPLGTTTPTPVPANSKGASTRSASRVGKPVTLSSSITWHHWWARNRFKYLDFPTISEKPSPFPFTPGGDKDATVTRLRENSLTLLRPMLKDKSARLRRASLIGLARLNDAESLPEMMKRLQDSNQTVRDSAVLALGILDCTEAKHTLLHIARGTKAAMGDLDQSSIPDYFRGFAEVSLAIARTQGIGTVLKSILMDPSVSPEVKAMALESLGLLGGEDSVKFLLDFLISSKAPPRVMASAVTALSKTLDPAAIPFLERHLFDKRVEIQQSAALGLGLLARPGCEETVKKLHKCYKSTGDQGLKGFCLIAMGEVGGMAALKNLERVLVNGKRSDAPWACLGLGLALRETPDPKKLGRLLHTLKYHGNRSARGAAAVALGLVKCPDARETLIRLMEKGGDSGFRGYCALSLGMIGDEESLPALRKAVLRDNHYSLKTQAALGLALLNDVQSSPKLVDLLFESKNDVTKGFLALSLSYMGDTGVIDSVLDKIKKRTHDDLTLLHCVHLTSKLLSGETEPYLSPLAEGSNFASEYSVMMQILSFGI